MLWLVRRARVVYIVVICTVKWLPYSTGSFGKRPCSCITLMFEGHSWQLDQSHHFKCKFVLISSSAHFSLFVLPHSSSSFQACVCTRVRALTCPGQRREWLLSSCIACRECFALIICDLITLVSNYFCWYHLCYKISNCILTVCNNTH